MLDNFHYLCYLPAVNKLTKLGRLFLENRKLTRLGIYSNEIRNLQRTELIE